MVRHDRQRRAVEPYERDPAPEWLFEPRPLPADHIFEELTVPRAEAPALTVTADAGTFVAVTRAEGRDWSVRFSAPPEERDPSLRRAGATVLLGGRHPARPRLDAFLHVSAPADAPLVLYVSYGTLYVRDLAGPVHAAAPHGRITLLNTGGDVDATGGVIDFAGSSGRVVLSADGEINVKVTGDRFAGSLLAWAQGPVRVRVPADFGGPFEALVSIEDQFVCRAALRARIRAAAERGLWKVVCGAANGAAPGDITHLRSERVTVVIDQIGVDPSRAST